jgi:hypothetical protein
MSLVLSSHSQPFNIQQIDERPFVALVRYTDGSKNLVHYGEGEPGLLQSRAIEESETAPNLDFEIIKTIDLDALYKTNGPVQNKKYLTVRNRMWSDFSISNDVDKAFGWNLILMATHKPGTRVHRPHPNRNTVYSISLAKILYALPYERTASDEYNPELNDLTTYAELRIVSDSDHSLMDYSMFCKTDSKLLNYSVMKIHPINSNAIN